jgi:hypothetical protein
MSDITVYPANGNNSVRKTGYESWNNSPYYRVRDFGSSDFKILIHQSYYHSVYFDTLSASTFDGDEITFTLVEDWYYVGGPSGYEATISGNLTPGTTHTLIIPTRTFPGQVPGSLTFTFTISPDIPISVLMNSTPVTQYHSVIDAQTYPASLSSTGTLSWATAEGAVSYYLATALDDDPYADIFRTTMPSTSLDLSTLNEAWTVGRKWLWKIYAVNYVGGISESQNYFFLGIFSSETNTLIETAIANRANYEKAMRIWFSEVGDYNNNEEGNKDADAFSLRVPSTDEIRWIEALEALILGTSGSEWRIGSSKLDTPITPTNFNIEQQSNFGSAQIQALKVNECILFVDRYGRKLREMTMNDSGEKYTAPDLTIMAEHITKGKIKWMSFQQSPYSILWCGLEDGTVIGFVYDRQQQVTAWFKVPMDCFVMSGCVVPGTTQDILWLSLNRVIGGADVTYIERMAEFDFTTIADAIFADCCITVTNSSPSSTLAVGTQLAGVTVGVLADGVELDDAVVDGSGNVAATLAGVAVLVTTAQVGIKYDYKVKPMRLVMGDSMGSNIHISELVISFHNSKGAKHGIKDTDLLDVNFADQRWVNSNSSDITGLFTGEIVASSKGNIDPLVPFMVAGNSMYPCTVRAIIARTERTGR